MPTVSARCRYAVIAIDAGNSKTDGLLIAADGQVVASARSGPFRPHQVGVGAAVDSLAALVEQLRSAVGARAGVPVAQHVSACLANADLDREVTALHDQIAGRGWSQTTTVRNDTFGLLRAGLDAPDGVAVVCGAGINCAGICADGTTARFAAVGHISGDWGGGGGLWQEAMWWAARAEDGRGPETALREALPRSVGLDSMAELIAAVHLGDLPETSCLQMTPLLFEVSASGDQVARGIVLRQAEEVVRLAVAAIRRLGRAGTPIDVVLGGGVLTAGHRDLMTEIDRLLTESQPHARTRVVRAAPVLGAGLLGLDEMGADQESKLRLRTTFAS
ncbi:N-acetylglucosamine kinase [Branchiibius cervicis]|uniref:N-acetylglucosamine kinase n=1 Tax=Branchiibius cervicis TaxID=908252 RepID=A0ABW2ARN1_9MICO